MPFKLSLNKLTLFLLYISILSFPINYKIVFGLRAFDFFYITLLSVFLFKKPKVNKIFFGIFIFIILVLILSSVNGFIINGTLEISRLGFIYKYLLIFSLPWIVLSIIDTYNKLYTINRLLLLTFMLLCIWTYIYIYLVSTGIVIGNFRPSFPLSNDYIYSDAHLYSSYLGFFTIAYLFYLKIFFKHSLIISLLIISNALLALFLTGSRTGLLMLSVALLLYSLYAFVNFPRFKVSFSRKKTITTILIISILTVVFSTYISNILNLLSDYQNLLDRALNFNLAEDESSLGRIVKLKIAIEDLSSAGNLIGLGLSSSLLWYDGLVPILLAHGGTILLFTVGLFYTLVVYKSYCNAKKTGSYNLFLLFLLLCFIYLLSNLITEYIFISRNAFPILLIITIIYASINNKYLTHYDSFNEKVIDK